MGKLLLIALVIGSFLFFSNDQFRSRLEGFFNELIDSDNYSSKSKQSQSTPKNYVPSNVHYNQSPSSNSNSLGGSSRGVFARNRNEMTSALKKDGASYQQSKDIKNNAQALQQSGASYSLKQDRYQNQSTFSQKNNSVSASLAQVRASIKQAMSAY